MKYADPVLASALARGYFASLDPGKNHPAAAVFKDGQLIAASRVLVPGKVKLEAAGDEGEHARIVAELVASWILKVTNGAGVHALAAEWPQIYTAAKSKGDPNDLVPLGGINVGVATRLNVRLHSRKPAEWVGGIPKVTTGDATLSPRGRLVLGRLGGLERSVIVISHDAIDAVGIGLHMLGRLGKTFA